MISDHVIADLPIADLPAAAASAAALAYWYFSTGGYISGHADAVADQYFEERVTQALQFDRAIPAGARIAGLARGTGEAVLANGDRALDVLLDGYAIDGRDVIVRHGRKAWAYAEFRTIFAGVMAGYSATRDELRIEVRDALDELDQPIQASLYAGSGGAEGGDDLKGKPKPLAFGSCFNVTAPILDAATETYQPAAHQVSGITATRDRGVALSAVGSGSPAPGEYEADNSTGIVTLGGAPDGAITHDIDGHADPAYVATTSTIVQRILESFASFSADQLDLPSFARLENRVPAPVGIWLGAEQFTHADVIDRLLFGAGAYCAIRRDGRLAVGQFEAPTGAPIEIPAYNIISVERDSLPGAAYPPTWRQTVGYKKNYTIQTDLAGSVTDAIRTSVATEYREAAAADAGVQAGYPLAADAPRVPAYFTSEAGALTEATRLQALYGVHRSIYQITLNRFGFGLDIHDHVYIKHSLLGLKGGVSGRIIAIADNVRDRSVRISVFV